MFRLGAQAPGSTISIPRTGQAIVFDGYMSEAAWDISEPFPMIMHDPIFGNPPTEESDIRLIYDDEYIYVAAMLYDRDPSKVQLTSKKRDEFGGGSDWFAVILDTYNDNENAVAFLTTPSGLRTDATVFNDAVGGEQNMPVNSSWNTFWDVITHVTGEGWSLEMRIPISSLRFQEEEGRVTMGLIMWRWIPHANEIQIFPSIPPEFGQFSFWKPSKAQDVIFEDIQGKNPFYIIPYSSGGFEQRNDLSDDESEYIYSDKPKFEPGLDLKYGLTSNMTLDLTVNTDFAQVEADDEIVNMTRFDYFFPEKRQFFLERSSIFEFNTGGPNNMLFYSRRIGLDEDEGEIVRIWGGARLLGRKGPWDIGFLNMQTAKSTALPSENFGVLRLKRRTFNSYSYLGGIVTSRLGVGGTYNIAYGLDALVRITGDEYLKIVGVQTMETGNNSGAASLDPSRFHLGWERRKDVGLFYDLFTDYAGRDYNPGIGFESREDYFAIGAIPGMGWLPGEESRIKKHSLSIRSFNFIKNSKNKLESIMTGPNYELITKNNFSFTLWAYYNYENVFETFELSDDVSVPVGEYQFPAIQGSFMTPLSYPLMVAFMTQSGGYYDGNLVSTTINPIWSVSSSLELSGFYQYNRADFAERDQLYIAHIARLKAQYMYSTKLSVSAFIQFNSAENGMISNFRFRYNPREGNDFYIVYNEGTNTRLDRDFPELPMMPRMDYRTILLKYTYTFIL